MRARANKAGCDSPPKSVSFSLPAPLLSHTHPHPAAPAHPVISAWFQSFSPALLITSDHTLLGTAQKCLSPNPTKVAVKPQLPALATVAFLPPLYSSRTAVTWRGTHRISVANRSPND